MRHLGNTLTLLSAMLLCLACNKRVPLTGDTRSSAVSSTNQYTNNTATPTPTPTATPATRWQSTTSHIWATLDKQTVFNSTSPTVLMFDNVIEDPLSEYNKASGIFAPKAPGLYKIHASLTLPGPWTAGDYCKIYISKSQLTIGVNMSVMPTHQRECMVSIDAVVPLNVGEGIIVSSIIAGAERRSNNLVNNPYITLNIAKVAE